MRNKYLLPIIIVSILANLLLAWQVWAGSPDSPDAPTATSSYTLQDLYNRLTAGTAGTPSTFTEPATAPGAGTMRTINEIMAAAPAPDNTNGATLPQVLTGQTFWGLTGSEWGLHTGTMPDNGAGSTIVPTTTNQSLAAGYWSTANTVTGDADLAAGNIRSGVNLFGVNGSLVGASGNATDAQVLAGQTYSNDSGASTGTMPNNGAVTLTPGTTNQTIAAGYHNGSGTVTGDADLAAGNIRSGVNLFGVNGSLVGASGNATDAQVLAGQTYSNDSGASTGTMPNNGAVTITPGTTNQTIAAGYHNGSGTVTGDADLVAGNIAQGVNLFGVDGTLTGGGTYNAGVPKTGQTTSYASRDDGDLERGVTWPNPRFTNNGNGTVTDNLTGLIWLRNANCFGGQNWANALTSANNLASGDCGLTDGSSAGDWRLPNLRELQSLVDYGRYDPTLPNGYGTYFTGVQSYVYWSSSTYALNTSYAWYVYLTNGFVVSDGKTYAYYVWPVRGGQ